MAATWQLTTMDSQGQSSQNQPTHSMRPGSCNSSTENDILRDPSTEGQGESQAPPAYGKFFDQPRQALQLQQLFSFEAEAKKILCSDNLQLIQPLLRFGLYGDENSLRHNLQHIRTFKLDHILTALLGDTQMIVEKDRKVNKILDLVESDRTPPNVGSDWEPRDTIAMDAEQIASRIELESHLLFKNIRVEHCLKHAIGWMERSIKNLFVQHRCFSFKIRCYLREYPMEREKFIHVEEKLRNRSPLAHQAVRNGLLPPEHPAYFHLEPICEPLRTLAEDETISLGAILTRLPILAERFDCLYKQVLSPTWPRFITEVDTFNALIASSSAIEYAREMTISDMKDFDLMCPKALKASGSPLILFKNWGSFRDAIAECCKAYPRLNYRINEIAYGFRRYRNWHRLAAIVHGQKQAGVHSPHFSLITPNSNYVVFRAEMKRCPGLPFLIPFLTQFRNAERVDLIEAFSFVPYSVEAAFAQSAHRPGILRNLAAHMRRAL